VDHRITTPEPSANGTHRPDAPTPDKPKRQPTRKPKPAARQSPRTATVRPTVRAWALFGVAFMSALSAGLNGYANAQHSPVAWAGWLMGLAVPVIVLTLAKVAGEKWRAGQRRVGGLAGASGAALLFLSVWHCANSIALLTGSPLALAMPMAVAIDCGLVACEIALITEPRD
jgi:hypothetical protein